MGILDDLRKAKDRREQEAALEAARARGYEDARRREEQAARAEAEKQAAREADKKQRLIEAERRPLIPENRPTGRMLDRLRDVPEPAREAERKPEREPEIATEKKQELTLQPKQPSIGPTPGGFTSATAVRQNAATKILNLGQERKTEAAPVLTMERVKLPEKTPGRTYSGITDGRNRIDD